MADVTPDILTDTTAVKKLLRLKGSAQDDNLAFLIAASSAGIAHWCRVDFFLASNPANPITEYLSGSGHRRLLLSHSPVQAPILTGTTSSGSAVVTGLSSTAFLFANQSVAGSTLPAGSYILSVDSATQVTLNQAATAAATGTTLVFGLGMWSDSQAYWGSAAGAFGSTTQIFEGGGFVLIRDMIGGGGSATGMVECINGTWQGRFVRDAGTLSSYLESGQGNLKVQYRAGLASLPADLQLAATKLTGFLFASGKNEGWPPAVENLSQHTARLIDEVNDPEMGSVRQLLAPYRRLVIGRA